MSFRESIMSAKNFCHAVVSTRFLSGAILLCSLGLVFDGNTAHGQTLQMAQSEESSDVVTSPDANNNSSAEEPGEPEEAKGANEPIQIQPVDEAELDKYPRIMRDLSELPFPVRRMRELILEATKTGDIDKLRPLIGYGDDVTMLSLGGIEEDPLNFLKSLSGDKEGHEILAILAEVLESGFVRMDEGTDTELYVWPYFFAWPLDKLSPAQKVELYRLVTYGDFQDMEAFGAYIFYRLGITPRGRWRFFVAGD